MNTYNSITPIQGHNLLRPVFYEEQTYSALWASILAAPPKADEQKKNETPLRTDQLTMSEGRPNLNSSNTHKVAHGNFILEAFVIVVFAPGAAQAISKRCHSQRFCCFGVCPSLFRGCGMFRIMGGRHSEPNEKSKHFRIRVGEFGVTVQEWRSKFPTTHYNFICCY